MRPTSASVGARRLGVSLWLCVVIQFVAPAPALAWFGWLDKWSGPGEFKGWLYEARLVCFGDQSGVRQIQDAYLRAQQSTRRVSRLGRDLTPEESRAILSNWEEVLLLLEAAQLRWHASEIDRRSVQTALQRWATLVSTKVADVTSLTSLTDELDKEIEPPLNRLAGQVIAQGATGILWSVCSDQKERRLSIELNIHDWRGVDNDNNRAFSNGNTIRLITVMPSITWNVIGNRKADVLDVGMGGGFYAFSSKGFDTVRGFIIQPVRIDLHAPTAWAGYEWSDARRWLSLLTFRWGLVSVPSGFAADAFADASRAERIPAEFVQSVAVFGNLNSLLSNPRKK